MAIDMKLWIYFMWIDAKCDISWHLTWNKTKVVKQSLESAQYGLEISFKSMFQNFKICFSVTDPSWNELSVQHTSYIQYLHDGTGVQVAEKKWRN